jgi:hypothetical protein
MHSRRDHKVHRERGERREQAMRIKITITSGAYADDVWTEATPGTTAVLAVEP